MKKGLKNNKGITLIALVITIIVLLILAGATIATLTGDNGLLTRAESAKEANRAGTVDDEVKLWITDTTLYNATKVGTAPKDEDAMLADLKSRNLVKDEEINTTDKTITIDKRVISYKVEGNTPILNLPSTADTKPYLPDDKSKVIENDIDKGIVVEDKNKNEWVWVVVPKTQVFKTAISETDYANIKTDLVTYAAAYRVSRWDDVYYTGIGFANEAEYTNLYNRMLTSVYKYGGFWIGRYEAGTETLRTTESAELTPIVSKQGVYPYNYVTVEQAQGKAKEINPDSSNKVSSLMFGIQWDLTLKYIEEKGKLEDGTKVTQNMIKTDSSNWGNYNNVTFNITKGKYSINNGTTFTPISGTYTKPINTNILLTTGVSERNKMLNIYDLAGNEFEFTIEKKSDESNPCANRGGNCYNLGSYTQVAFRYSNSVSVSGNYIAFRPTLII